jgi:hypothetical protein
MTLAKVITACIVLVATLPWKAAARLTKSRTNSVHVKKDNVAQRSLATSNTLEWTECRNNSLDAQQCKDLIEKDAESHHLPGIVVDIHYPVTSHPNSYWKVGIPTNYEGIVIGNAVDGNVHWNGVWEGQNGLSRAIGPWNCGKMNAIQCCNSIQRDVPDKDLHGNYLECYVTQEHPSPYVKDDGTVGYCSWVWDIFSKEYNPVDLTLSQIVTKDIVAKKLLKKNIDQLTKYLRDGQAPWRSFEIVNNSCHVNARKYPRLQRACNDMDTIFHPPNTPGGTIVVDAFLEGVLDDIKRLIENYIEEPFVMEHRVTIYASDESGSSVKNHPMIGGKSDGPVCIPP